MITVPEAETAYERVVRCVALPGDTDLLIAAAQQGGMPPLITELGTNIQTAKDTHEVYMAYPTESNLTAWQQANTVLRQFVTDHFTLLVPE